MQKFLWFIWEVKNLFLVSIYGLFGGEQTKMPGVHVMLKSVAVLSGRESQVVAIKQDVPAHCLYLVKLEIFQNLTNCSG